jgi:Fuc2NAc and GlcNAc transferase
VSSYLFLIQFFIFFLLSVALTWGFLRYCYHIRWLDIPNKRSAHFIPVPKAGGMVFALLFESAATWMFIEGQLSLSIYLAALLGLPAMLLGLLDDCFNLTIRVRLVTQFAISLILLVLFGGFPELPLPGLNLDLGYAGYLAGLFLFVWIFNLFNFMDGMDGLATGELMFILFAVWLVTGLDLHSPPGQLCVILFCLLTGFLVFNFPPASLFMGDTGSNFLACIVIFLALLTAQQGLLTFWTWGILIGLFMVDSTFTLLRRMLSGAVWYHAHSSHAYQYLMRITGSQKRTLLLLMMINILWLLPLAWLSTIYREFSLIVLIIAYCPLVFMVCKLGAGRNHTLD